MSENNVFHQYFYVKFIPLYIASEKRGFERWFLKIIHNLFTDLFLTRIKLLFYSPLLIVRKQRFLPVLFSKSFIHPTKCPKNTVLEPCFTKKISQVFKTYDKFICIFHLRVLLKRISLWQLVAFYCPVWCLKRKGECLLV